MAHAERTAAAFPSTLASTVANGGGTRLFSTPLTTTHTSYTDSAGHALLRNAVHDDKANARMAPDVAAGLLFAHRGAAPIDQRYQSSYRAAFTAGTGHALPPPVDRTVAKLRDSDPVNAALAASSAERENQSRQRSYRTATSDAFSPASSVAALPVHADQQLRGAGMSTRQQVLLSPLTGQPLPHTMQPQHEHAAVKKGECGSTLEQNYRQLHLRR
jgi:hypothetical protein